MNAPAVSVKTFSQVVKSRVDNSDCGAKTATIIVVMVTMQITQLMRTAHLKAGLTTTDFEELAPLAVTMVQE